jgi:hypothetical protein
MNNRISKNKNKNTETRTLITLRSNNYYDLNPVINEDAKSMYT